MYIYLDKNGTVKEFINDKPLRQYASNDNIVYVFYAGDISSISSVTATYELSDGTIVPESEVATSTTTSEIPYNAERDLKYFEYYKDYAFYKFALSDEALAVDGTTRLTLRLVSKDSLSIKTAGLITFEVESAIAQADWGVTTTQYNYLVKLWTTSTDIGYLPLDGSKAMQGEIDMASFPIKLDGKELYTSDDYLYFNGDKLARVADLSAYVDLSSAQEITGIKKFKADMGIAYGSRIALLNPDGVDNGAIAYSGATFYDDTLQYSTKYAVGKIVNKNVVLTLPSKVGTLALKSDIDDSKEKWYMHIFQIIGRDSTSGGIVECLFSVYTTSNKDNVTDFETLCTFIGEKFLPATGAYKVSDGSGSIIGVSFVPSNSIVYGYFGVSAGSYDLTTLENCVIKQTVYEL